MSKKGLFFLLLWGVSFVSLAGDFSIRQANQTLKNAQYYTKNTRISLSFLQEKVTQLNEQFELAERCVKKKESELRALSETIKLAEAAQGASTSGADLRYLKKQRSKRQGELADCRLFQFKAEDVLAKYQKLISKIAKQRIWSKDKPLWQTLSLQSSQFFLVVKQGARFVLGSMAKLSVYEGASFLLLMGLVFTGLKFLVRFLYKRFCHSWFSDEKQFINKFQFAAFSFFLTCNLFINGYLSYLTEGSVFGKVILIFFIYFSLVIFLKFFKHLKISAQFFSWLKYDLVTVYCFGRFTAAVSLIFMILIISVESGYLNSVEVRLMQSVVMIASYVLLYWFFGLLIRNNTHLEFLQNNRTSIITTLIILLLVSIALDLIGYHTLVFYVCQGVLLTLPVFFLFDLSWQLLNRLYSRYCGREALAKRLRTKLGVERGDLPLEFIILNLVTRALLSLTCIALFLNCWDLSGNTRYFIFDAYFKGFTVLGFLVVPHNLINALVLFCVLNLFVRYFSNRLALVEQKKEQEGHSQINISPILMYLGFFISLLVALLIAGVNLTGIAIVAGALSVGIGLGLKNIINNFVSGLILLFERPIKAGDRIKVDDYEGIVTKVRVRATEIRSRDRSEIIIPNEEMITKPVTNFMLRESMWRIKCFVGVGYDSDVELVKTLLLDIANNHPGVVNDDELNKPNVLFLSFGDSSLEFVLRCIIKDVNRKNFIISDLNFAIFKAFKENGIEIPFPQRDIHFKPDDNKM